MRLEHLIFAILVVAVLYAGQGCKCNRAQTLDEEPDKLRPDSTRQTVPTEKAEILRQYFEQEGMTFDVDSDPTRVDRYQPEIVAKMAGLLEIRDNLARAFELNCQINSMLYRAALDSGPSIGDDTRKLTPEDKAALQALDLIVPSSKDQPIFDLAKEDLNQFCLEHSDLCRELLQRILGPLEKQELYTMNVMHYLESIYHNWIPLARLTDYIENNGKATISVAKE